MTKQTLRPIVAMSMHTRRLMIVAAAMVAMVVLAVVPGATNVDAATSPTSYTIDTGWVSNFDGGCQAKAHVVYYPGSDQAHIETTVTSPYWFAACRVNTQVWVETRVGSFPGAVHYTMACGVFDPSCASTRFSVNDYFGQTPGLTAHVASVNAALEAMGLPATYTRTQAVTGIRVVFTKA